MSIIERAKTWRLDHLEYHKKVRKERYQSNPELYKAKTKEWRDANLNGLENHHKK